MTPAPQSRLWLLVGCAAALALGGAVIDRVDPFPRLRFAIQRGSQELASSRAVDLREVVQGRPLLSMYLPPDDLRDLRVHKMEHGRAWERAADVSYYNHGRLLFAGQVGARIHGGGSRITSPRQGFRLFLRREYGSTHFPVGVPFGTPIDPLRRLVVHNDVRRDADGSEWHLVNPLAYDLARRIGGITPETQPAAFILNGEEQGLFVLTEHFDDEYFEAHRPGHRVTMEVADMERLRDRVDATRPMTLAALRPLIDMDNLTTWFLSVLFCATRDAYQGPGQFLDESVDAGGWFWVTWDLDQSFRDWDLDSFQYLLERVGERPRGRRPSEPRGVIVTTLIGEDPAFRAYFEDRFDAMLNHQLTPAFLDDRLAHYTSVAAEAGVSDLGYAERERTFFEKRPAFLRQAAEQWLNTAPSVPVVAARDGGGPLLIDGFREEGRYSGSYFPGREVTAASVDGSSLRWFVNGALSSEGPTFRVAADRPMAIVATTSQAPALQLATPAPVRLPEPAAPKPITWARIPGGKVLMGCVPSDTACDTNEVPREQVAVAPFALMTTEVTVAQYAAFARAAGRAMPRQPIWSGDQYPVVNTTWDEANAFCASAGGRLPHEGEWALAARGGQPDTIYPWGNAYRAGFVNGLGLATGDVWPNAAPVGSLPASAYGLYDIIGNVWEWTADWYREGAGWTTAPASAPDPASPGYLKTVRGGSWDNRRDNLRISSRVGLLPDARQNFYVGFRCAR
jgi:formylglycine-generating enzyme required for sulfatase activity